MEAQRAKMRRFSQQPAFGIDNPSRQPTYLCFNARDLHSVLDEGYVCHRPLPQSSLFRKHVSIFATFKLITSISAAVSI